MKSSVFCFFSTLSGDCVCLFIKFFSLFSNRFFCSYVCLFSKANLLSDSITVEMRRSQTSHLIPESTQNLSSTGANSCAPLTNKLDRHLPPLTSRQESLDSGGNRLCSNLNPDKALPNSYGNIKRSASETRIRKKTGALLFSLPGCLSTFKVVLFVPLISR